MIEWISGLIGESTDYDKKEALEEKRPKIWLKSISAFANGKGGMLIFGVDDSDNIIGLKDVMSDSGKISEILKMKMDPVPQTQMDLLSEDGNDVSSSTSHPVRRLRIIMSGKETGQLTSASGMRVYRLPHRT